MEADPKVPFTDEMNIQDEHNWESGSWSSSRRSNDSNVTLLSRRSSVEQHEDERQKDSDTLFEHGDAALDAQGIADPRLKDYPIPLVAQTVHLRNDDSEPILTFRVWLLSTFWVLAGCSISTVYYFKPFSVRLSGYVVQLCTWKMGQLLASALPTRPFTVLGRRWTLNPGRWSAKEHALVVIAYWGSSYTAYGLGPLSAMELFYGKRLSSPWAITFLVTTQLTGYGLVGLYRHILVRPPSMYYPGILPTVSLFNAMHGDPRQTASSLRVFMAIASAAFVYQWLPSFVFPLLSSLPLLCWVGRGSWEAFVLGSGSLGFGLMDFSLDWNYVAFLSPLFTPLWANANRFVGAALAVWITYPVAYFSDALGSLRFPPMSSETFDTSGGLYNVSRIMTPSLELNQTALELYSTPRWSFSYAMHFFWGFASASAMVTYAVLFHGRTILKALANVWSLDGNTADDIDSEKDPYVKLTSHHARVPQAWYALLLAVCLCLGTIQLYAGDMQLPWWGLQLVVAISALFTLPCGMLFATANVQIGMDYVSEVLAGALFPGRPVAVLTATVYGRQVLEQCLNLASDLKLGFYMKIPEWELLVAQVYGTLLGPFVNWAVMRLIIDTQGAAALLGREGGDGKRQGLGLGQGGGGGGGGGGQQQRAAGAHTTEWNALKTKNFFSSSVIWGVMGPARVFGGGDGSPSSSSPYRWLLPSGFAVGAAAVLLLWLIHKARPAWRVQQWPLHPAIIFHGASLFPVFPTTNLTSSMAAAVASMGVMRRWHPRWFARWNYLLGAGLDCGAQLVQMVLGVAFLVFNRHGQQMVRMPHWWGNDAVAVDQCFPPPDLPSVIMSPM
uniref:Oligopeptide transporter phomP2 n=1 Tax=Diaporthe leptostromiformis TaxID=291059 RepID=PHP21_DIALO|nr:RecName: Full=Oligopeptide transporter phomP2; AltName: Full=Phomopsin biosynthesis cluster protein P2 [Diaporthe leptostromiformis]BDA39147.1 oligopeptide transporter [Diaporthe leptostromiformis]